MTDEPSALFAALSWVSAMLSGTMATTIATVAVACLGFSMLRGSITARRGLNVILGCFLMFGAGSVANSLMALAWIAGQTEPQIEASPAPPPELPPPPEFDPYAGASVFREQR